MERKWISSLRQAEVSVGLWVGNIVFVLCEDKSIAYPTKESRRFSMFLEDLILKGMLTFAFFPVYKGIDFNANSTYIDHVKGLLGPEYLCSLIHCLSTPFSPEDLLYGSRFRQKNES